MFDSPIRAVQPIKATRALRRLTFRRRPSRAQLDWARWFAKTRGTHPDGRETDDAPLSNNRHHGGPHELDLEV